MLLRFIILLLLAGCVPRHVPTCSQPESDYYLVIYVSSKNLDYSSTKGCLRSLRCNAKDGRFGHAWVYLHGATGCIEGGHSGELGVTQPRYFDGVAGLVEVGDPNPIRYLGEPQRDGFFQKGCGGHNPTFAAKRDLTAEQFERIRAFMQAYNYRDYSLTGQQCTSFVIAIAALADWLLEGQITLPIASTIRFGGVRMRLWSDPRYSTLTFFTPDRLEQSLRASVKAGFCTKLEKRYVLKKLPFRAKN